MIATGLGRGVFGDEGQTQGHKRIAHFPFRPQVELQAKRRAALRRGLYRVDEGHLGLELRLRDGIQDLLDCPRIWHLVPGAKVLHEVHHSIAVFGAHCGRIVSHGENVVDVVLQLLRKWQLDSARIGAIRFDDHHRFH